MAKALQRSVRRSGGHRVRLRNQALAGWQSAAQALASPRMARGPLVYAIESLSSRRLPGFWRDGWAAVARPWQAPRWRPGVCRKMRKGVGIAASSPSPQTTSDVIAGGGMPSRRCAPHRGGAGKHGRGRRIGAKFWSASCMAATSRRDRRRRPVHGSENTATAMVRQRRIGWEKSSLIERAAGTGGDRPAVLHGTDIASCGGARRLAQIVSREGAAL